MRWITRFSSARKRGLAWVTLFGLAIATATLAGKSKPDPLLKEIEKFEAQIEAVFRPNSSVPGAPSSYQTFERDKTLSMGSPELASVESAFTKIKIRIEAVSFERRGFKVNEEGTQSLAEAAMRYRESQKRLVLNYLRLAHQKVGEESRYQLEHYDHLNLLLYGPVGIALAENLESEQSIIHRLDSDSGGYHRVEFGINPKEKEELELQVLNQAKGENAYAKLVHFLATRSRILNHFTLQRLSPPGSLADPELKQCGENFLSFRQSEKSFAGGYYSSLKVFDQKTIYTKVFSDDKFLRKIESAQILDVSELERFFEDLLKKYPSYQDRETGILVELASGVESLELSFEEKVQKQINSFALLLHQSIQETWKKQAGSAVKISNFFSDSWSSEAVADRIGFVIWEGQKSLLTSVFLEGLKKNNLMGKVTEKELRPWIDEILESRLGKQEKRWRASMKKEVQNELEAYASVQALGGLTGKNFQLGKQTFFRPAWDLHEENFQSFLKTLRPVLQKGLEADGVRKHAEAVRRKHVEKFVDEAWRKDPSSFKVRWSHHILNGLKASNLITAFVGRPTQYYAALRAMQNEKSGGVMIPASLYMKKMLVPSTPDELSQYYFKKLEYWKTQKEFLDLQKIAQEIDQNKVLKQAMERFFEKLAESHFRQLAAFKPSKAEPEFKPTLSDGDIALAAVEAKDTVDRLLKESNPFLIPTPTPIPPLPSVRDFRLAPNRADATSAIKVLRHELPPKLESDDRPGMKLLSRVRVNELFFEAMAMLGLAKPVFAGLAKPVFAKVSLEPGNTRVSARSFLKIESLLLEGVRDVTRDLSSRFVQTVLDQQILAETLYGAAMAKQPLLAIQFENEVKSPTVLDRISQGKKTQFPVNTDQNFHLAPNPAESTGVKKFYPISRVLTDAEAESEIRSALRTVLRNQHGLVAESCSARPMTPLNEEWRNVFRSSSGVRSILKLTSSHYAKYDEAWMKATRTRWEAILEDYLDPIGLWFFYATGVIMVVLAVFSGGAGLAGVLAVGRTWGWNLGKGAVQRIVGRLIVKNTLATTILAANQPILQKLGMTAAGKLIYYFFTVQVLTMGYVNLIELPPHVKYQLRVANSEFEGKLTADRKAIREFADQLYAKQLMTGGVLVLQGLMLKPLIRDAKALMGARSGAESLQRMAAVNGGKEVVTEMTAKTYTQWVAEKGFLEGSRAWFKQSAYSLQNTLRISAVSRQATKDQALQLMQKRMQRMFPTEASYQELVEQRMVALERLGSKAKQTILSARQSSGKIARMQNWIRDHLARYLLKGKYWDIAMSRASKQALSYSLNSGRATDLAKHEIWEWMIAAYMDDLAQTKHYWTQKLKIKSMLESELRTGAIKGKNSADLLDLFFDTLNHQDMMMHEELMNWTLAQTSGGAAMGWVKKQLGTTSEIREFKSMFHDYKKLIQEIDGLNPPPQPKPSGAGAETAGGTAAETAAETAGETAAQTAENARAALAAPEPVAAPMDDLATAQLIADFDALVSRSDLTAAEKETLERLKQKMIQAGFPPERITKPTAESMKSWDMSQVEDVIFVDLDPKGNPIVRPMTPLERAKYRIFRFFKSTFDGDVGSGGLNEVN